MPSEVVHAASVVDDANGPTNAANAVGSDTGTLTTDSGNVDWGYGRWTIDPTVGAPTTGTGQLRIWTRSAPDTSSTPVIRAQIWTGGVLRQTLTDQNITSASGQWLSWSVDQSLWAGAADVQVGVQVDRGGGSPSRRDTGQIGVLELTVDTAAVVTATTMRAWSGSVWSAGVLKRWDGSVWQDAMVQRWSGSVWEDEPGA